MVNMNTPSGLSNKTNMHAPSQQLGLYMRYIKNQIVIIVVAAGAFALGDKDPDG